MTDRSGPSTGVSFLQSWSLITVLVVAIPLTVLAVVFWPGGAPLGPDGPDSPFPNPPPIQTTATSELADASNRLVGMGWTKTAADAVTEISRPYLEQLKVEDELVYDQQLSLLGRLGKRRAIQEYLSRHPDTAGLFAGSLDVDSQSADLILRVLVRNQDEPLVRSLFAFAVAPADIVLVAQALDRDGDLILSLVRRGAWNAVPWFLVSLEKPSAQLEWRRWLHDLFSQALASGRNDALDRVQVLLTIHAPTVQELLVRSDSFRTEFSDRHWPAFSQILDQQSDEVGWGVFVSEPRVWQFFADADAVSVRLFESHGPLAVDLLTDPLFMQVRPRIVAALQHSNERVIAAFFDDELRNQPLFAQLLSRDLPGGALSAALARFDSAPDRIPQELEFLATLDNDTLIAELGPPPSGPQTWLPGYSLYYLSSKWATGRRVSGLDVALTAAETVLDVIPLAKGAKGLKAVQKAVSEGLVKRGVTLAGATAEKASTRALFPWVLRDGFSLARNSLTSIERAAQVDVTAFVRQSFQYSGVGRNTFRRFSGLEARIFMRADRRVVIDLAEVAKEHHLVGRVARHAMSGAVQQIAEATGNKMRHIDETGLRAANVIVGTATTLIPDPKSEKLVDRAWKAHLAAWWMACALGDLDS